MPVSKGEVDGHILRVTSTTGMKTPRGGVDGQVQSTSYGFGFAYIRFTGIVETLLINSVTPIDEEYVDVRFSFRVKKVGNATLLRALARLSWVRSLVSQSRTFLSGKIRFTMTAALMRWRWSYGIFRRWCKQFYAENEESKDTAAKRERASIGGPFLILVMQPVEQRTGCTIFAVSMGPSPGAKIGRSL